MSMDEIKIAMKMIKCFFNSVQTAVVIPFKLPDLPLT